MADINPTATVSGIPWLDNQVDVAGNFNKGLQGGLAIREQKVREAQQADNDAQTQAFITASAARTADQQARTQLLQNMEPYQETFAQLRNQQLEAGIRDHQNMLEGESKLADFLADADFSSPTDEMQMYSILKDYPSAFASPSFQTGVQRFHASQLAQARIDQINAMQAGRKEIAQGRYSAMLGVAQTEADARIQSAIQQATGRTNVADINATARMALLTKKDSDAADLAAAQRSAVDDTNDPIIKSGLDAQFKAINSDPTLSLQDKNFQTQSIMAKWERIRQQNQRVHPFGGNVPPPPRGSQFPASPTTTEEMPLPPTAIPNPGPAGIYPQRTQSEPSGGMDELPPRSAAPGYSIGVKYRSANGMLTYMGGDPDDPSSWQSK